MKKKLQSYFSLMGKSFLMAVAVMSFFALLLSVGAVLKNPHFIEAAPLLGNQAVQFVAALLNESGLVVINSMPLVFAVSIAVGMSQKEDRGLAAFSALIGYLFMLTFSALALRFFGLALEPVVTVGDNNVVSISQTLEMRKAMQATILGMQTIDTGVLGGIVVGLSAAAVTKRFKTQKLPMAFGFYQGKHFPPIMIGLIFALVGFVVTFVWPIVGNGIYAAADVIVSGSGVIGSFLFGFIERLLIPTGLHHVWYSIVHFTPVGGEMEIGGTMYAGTKAITTAALSDPDFHQNISDITRLWLGQGATPIKVFGIPAACLAYYFCAQDKNKAKAIAVSAAMASIFAGVTEPFEFLFLFLAPGLFLAHCALTGLSFAILDIMNASYLGSNNIIDLIVNGVLQGHKSTWIPVVIVGVIMFVAYFALFRWYISKFKVPLPGCATTRSETVDEAIAGETDEPAPLSKSDKDLDRIAEQIVRAVGGPDNIREYTNCISRLRIYLVNPEKINEPLLETVPDSMGVIRPSEEEVHIVFGLNVDAYRQAVDRVLKD